MIRMLCEPSGPPRPSPNEFYTRAMEPYCRTELVRPHRTFYRCDRCGMEKDVQFPIDGGAWQQLATAFREQHRSCRRLVR